MIKIPGQFGWRQHNRSDRLGSIWSSWNVDITSNEGGLRITPRGEITTNDIANLGVAIGFERFNGETNGFSTVAGDRVFETSSVSAAAAFAASNGATTHSSDTADIMFFRRANRLVTSLQTSLQSHNGGAGGSWSTVGSSPLTSGSVHMLAQYALRGYVSNNHKTVISFDTSMNTTAAGNANTFSLGTLDNNNIGLIFSKILAASNRLWLFTINLAIGQPCSTLAWDGATQDDPIAEYVHQHGGVLAATLVHDVPYLMTVEGFLESFNGGTFTKVPHSRLPINPNKYLKNSFSSLNDRWIHPNGLIPIENKKLNILVNNEYEDGTIEERMPSGVWEFDLDNVERGWYHKHSLSLHAGSLTDYGQNRISRVGGLFYAKTDDNDGTLLMGAQIYSDATNTKEVIETDNTDDDIQKYGYIVTPKIYSDTIEDAWQVLVVQHKKLLNSSDKIIVKYRVNDEASAEATITWVDTDTFTSTAADFANYSAGDEIEVIQGEGGGKTAHISSISEAGGTYTVNLDDTFTGVTTNTAKVRMQKWQKSIETSDQTVLHSKFPITDLGASPWVQIKLCLQFTGKNEVGDLTLINTEHQ
jgi:hypothetical protein